MSIWDNIKKFAQPYSDDDYEDEDYEDELEDLVDEPREASRKRRPSPFDTAATEDYTAPAAPAASASGFSGQVLNMNSGKQEVVLFHAGSFNDAAKAADELRKKKAVVLNMENVDKGLTRRVVDFLTGSVYALDGDVKKIAQSTYMFCPHNMAVVGNLESVPNDNDFNI